MRTKKGLKSDTLRDFLVKEFIRISMTTKTPQYFL